MSRRSNFSWRMRFRIAGAQLIVVTSNLSWIGLCIVPSRSGENLFKDLGPEVGESITKAVNASSVILLSARLRDEISFHEVLIQGEINSMAVENVDDTLRGSVKLLQSQLVTHRRNLHALFKDECVAPHA